MSLLLRVRFRIIAALLTLALALGGCSALRLAYNQAPELAYWWIDGYADLDGEQTAMTREALADWFAWHRSSQLRGYADLLASVRQQGQGDLQAGQICAWTDRVRRSLQTSFDHAVPAVAGIALTLQPGQLQHIAERYRKGNEEFKRDHLQPDLAERGAAAFKRTLERAESIYGTLDERQRALLSEGVAASPFDPQLWFAERQARQAAALATLRQLSARRADAAAAQSAIRAWGAQVAQSPRPAYRDYQQRLTAYNCALAARLHNSTSAEQRQRAAAKLKGWEDDLRVLIAEGQAPS